MMGKIWLNTVMHFKYFIRNHVLLGIVAIYALYMIVLLMPGFTGDSVSLSVYQLVFLNYIVSCLMALMLISENLKSRCVKMVLTKPCPPDAWLASCFLSIIIISASITVATVLYTLISFGLGKSGHLSAYIYPIIFLFISGVVTVSFLVTWYALITS